MYEWEIIVLRQNQFDKHDPTDPKAVYSWGLTRKDTVWKVQSGFYYSDVLLLMKHFNVQNASDLVGMTFESEQDDPSAALDILMVTIRHGGNYTPPSSKMIRERAIVALAQMVCPDYSALDKASVANAFAEVWDGQDISDSWLRELRTKLDLFGGVYLKKVSPRGFSVKVRGPASYFEITKAGVTKKVIIGPYSKPVEFVD